MGSILQTIQDKSLLSRNRSLPVCQPDSSSNNPTIGGGIRRRLSSLSLNLQSISNSSSSTTTSTWRFPRSKSLSSVGSQTGTSIKRWWDRSWAWILSRKLPGFGEDLEMNEGEKREIRNRNNKGSWRHVLYKVNSELRKLYRRRSDNGGRLPVTFRSNYKMNFDY